MARGSTRSVRPCGGDGVRLGPRSRHNGPRRPLPAYPRVPAAHLTTSSLHHSASSSMSRTILLASGTEVREEYLAIDPYTRP
jgi:hypothetical protein